MLQNWTPEGLSESDLADGDLYHRSLYAEGNLEQPLSWHRDSIAKLVQAAADRISDGDIVVDYGTGTGGSAIELLKVLDSQGIQITLVLVDPLPSWFSKAWELLHQRSDVEFRLSFDYDSKLGRKRFFTVTELLDGRQANLILSSSTVHLIPSKTIPSLIEELYAGLVPGGWFIWDSGDIDTPTRPVSSCLLHDPYRGVQVKAIASAEHQAALSSLDDELQAQRILQKTGRIFPTPPKMNIITDAIDAVGFQSEYTTLEVSMADVDALRFILVPRLAAVAAGIEDESVRTVLIERCLAETLEELRASGQADENGYRSHWIYGAHQKLF
ncbi:class I SAM-dependent methyltransferase [Deltaproteobacteria bacterium]|nr:class I SAM-dependent methyltransferase [Deltaproteobacteria bacterium]